MKKATYLILGNSAAAIGCVEGIRQIDKTGLITIIASESHHCYGRPLISYLLMGRTDLEHMKYRDADFYAKNNVTFMPSETATEINPDKKTVTLASGTVIEYEKLLNATGSRPFVPPMTGLDTLKKYFTFMDLDSALEIEKLLTPESKVLIIGAGLIGTKCAEGIADRVKSTTIVEMAPRILPIVMPEEGSAIVQKELEKHNIHFVLNDSVGEFVQGKNLGGTAILKSGNGKIEFDILICAVGVRPNSQLIENAGGEADRGIVVDKNCKTSLKDIYAAGDCITSDDMTSGTRHMLALMPNAYIEGETAGINMAGGTKEYTTEFAMNAAGFFDLHIVSAGSYIGECIDASYQGCPAVGGIPAKKPAYRKFYIDNNTLKGFIMIGDAKRAGIYTSLVREQTPLSSINFDEIINEPQLMAFSKKERKAILAQ
jgi:NAD(P)H-nitrite reductase large subunit